MVHHQEEVGAGLLERGDLVPCALEDLERGELGLLEEREELEVKLVLGS